MTVIAAGEATSFDGVVEAVRQTVLASQVAGSVVALDVRAGSRVKAGQVLVRLDARAAEQQAGAAAAQVQAARAAQEAATRELDRQRQLFQKSYISQAALDRAEAQFKATQAEAAAQLASAGAALTQSGFYSIKAPYDGIVADVAVVLGDMAMPGRPLLTLYDPAALRVTAAVPQSAAAHIGSGNALQAEVPGAAAGRVVPVRWNLLPAVNPATHTLELRLDLPAGVAAVPGMFARAWLPGGTSVSPRFSVPARAVVRRAELTGLYVIGRRRHAAAAPGAPRARERRPGRGARRSLRRRAGRARSASRRAHARTNRAMNRARLGISGRIAGYFQSAQITPLLALVALLLGAFAVLVTPREEEPQINVTMANVIIPFPGASVRDVEQMVATPAEQVLSQIRGTEHVTSVSRTGLAVVTVQFKVGVSRTEALVRLYDTVNSNADWLPRGLGVGEPIIKPKGIADVPVVTLTLFARDPATGAFDLERVAHTLEADLKRVPGTREVTTIGGPGRAVRVEIDPARMAGAGVTVAELRQALLSANLGAPIGDLLAGDRALALEAGPYLHDARDVGELVVAVRDGKPVFLQDVATVVDGPLPAQHYVWHGIAGSDGGEFPAVTLAVTKKVGENAISVANGVMARVAMLRNTLIPHGIEVAETRNYGATANDKATKLIEKLLFATASVVALVFLTLGRREAAIVGSAVILTLTVTLFASWAWGFTLNRVSLFALIFSIGILVDDAIVVVENIHRHQALHPERALVELIPGAVDEVGGPTILATLTVIAALLPMAFVSGLMGPYMSPIPINASMGMLLSLAIAFVVTPWLARLWLKSSPTAHGAAPRGLAARIGPFFDRLFRPLLDRAPRRAQPRPARRRGGGADRDLARAADARAGRAEDAPVRQQVGVPGHRRHACGNAGGAHGRRPARAGRLPGAPARGHRLPGLRRHRRADQLQRARAPVLPARRRRSRRPAGEPARQASAQRAEPRDRDAPASRAAGDRPALRRQRQGGRSASRAAGALADRRRDLRTRTRGPARGRPSGAARVRADAGSRRRRRFRHRRCAAQAPAGRPPQGRAPRRAAGGDREHAARRALPARRPPTCTTRASTPPRRRSSCRPKARATSTPCSSSACAVPQGRSCRSASSSP